MASRKPRRILYCRRCGTGSTMWIRSCARCGHKLVQNPQLSTKLSPGLNRQLMRSLYTLHQQLNTSTVLRPAS